MSSSRATRILTIAEARRRAGRILPRVLFDYIEGGAEDEITLAENERAFRDLALRPRMGVAVEPDLATTVLGTPLAMPVILAPTGMVQLVHPDGAVGVARAAVAAGTISVLSRAALCPPGEVARRCPGPHWYQVASTGGREVVKGLIARAAEAGFTGLVVTLDGPPSGNRELELHHGVVPPVRPSLGLFARFIAQALARPRWTLRMLAAARRQKAILSSTKQTLSSEAMRRSARFTWADVEWLKREWSGSLLVKGVLTGADAIAARDAGADAIIVSNHGGRALDGAPATIAVLPEIVAAVGASTEVLLDGGIRRATSVAKALSLGARAVLIGRPFLYGLACAGQPGVERILEIFRTELVRTMKLLGCPDVASLDARWLAPMRDRLPDAARSSEPITERRLHVANDSLRSK
jgi:L-lactate dehydrogenase (cytochrome)